MYSSCGRLSGSRSPDESTVARVLDLHAPVGQGTNPLMVATADKRRSSTAIGVLPVSTIGPYLVIFSDPVVRSAAERPAFLDALFALAGELDRRPVFFGSHWTGFPSCTIAATTSSSLAKKRTSVSRRSRSRVTRGRCTVRSFGARNATESASAS